MSIQPLVQEEIEETVVLPVIAGSAAPAARARVATRPHTISVVLLARNQEATIERTVRSMLATLSEWTENFEVIVVDHGSSDRTAAVVAYIAATEPRLRVLQQPAGQGEGEALVTGLTAAGKAHVCLLDAGDEVDMRELERYFPLLDEYDAVLGYHSAPQRHLRRVGTWAGRRALYFVFGLELRRFDYAFRLYRADCLQMLGLEARGAMIHAEIVYKLARAGYTYTEVEMPDTAPGPQMSGGKRLLRCLQMLRDAGRYAGKWYQEEHGLL